MYVDREDECFPLSSMWLKMSTQLVTNFLGETQLILNPVQFYIITDINEVQLQT